MGSFKATWLGDGSPEAQIITEGGIEFIKGRPAVVPGDLKHNGIEWAEMIRNNPMFEVGTVDEDGLNTNDDDAEVAELRRDLDALGVKYTQSEKAPALRTKLEKATR